MLGPVGMWRDGKEWRGGKGGAGGQGGGERRGVGGGEVGGNKGKACSSAPSVDKEYTWHKVNTKKRFFFLQWLSYMFSLGVSEKLE